MRAGDSVEHGPTGETWEVSYADHDTGYMSWWGWPEGKAYISDCVVTESCTDEQHIKTLLLFTERKEDCDRSRVCERQLRKLEESQDGAFTLRNPEWLSDKLESSKRACEYFRQNIEQTKRRLSETESECRLMEDVLAAPTK